MSRKLFFVLLKFILLSSFLYIGSSPVVESTNGSKVRNENTGLSYGTIQEAINAIETLDGHTILVDAGTYYEHVTINKSLSLVGENRSTTIIDGSGAGTVVYIISTNDVNIINFTIQNGYEGVMFMDANNNTLRDNVITSQRFGVYLYFSSNNTLRENVISNCSRYGIGLDNSDYNILRDNNLMGNNYNFVVWGGTYIQDIDNSNTINGKTICYWVNQNNKHVPPDAGYVALVNSLNITIENLNLTENGQGLLLAYTSHSIIKNITVSNNEGGIWLIGSSHNTISMSMILNNTCSRGLDLPSQVPIPLPPTAYYLMDAGVMFSNSYSNILNSSTVSFNKGCGIKQLISSNNSILNCTISKNEDWGISLDCSGIGIVNSNFISENGGGISVWDARSGIITDNIVTSNRGQGISLYSSQAITLTKNNMTKNGYNFRVDFGAVPVKPIHNIDDSNTVDGKPICYWVKQHDRQVPSNAGYVALIESENITVNSLSLSENWQSILLIETDNSRMEGIDVSNNQIGIYLWNSCGNKISACTASSNYHGIVVIDSYGNEFDQNTAISNGYYGLYFKDSIDNRITCNTLSLNRFGIGLYSSSNNTIHYNNFIDNEEQVEHRGTPHPSNKWDDGDGEGNYWSDYGGVDADHDGIGDTPHTTDGSYKDNFPLMGTFSDFPLTHQEETYHVTTVCNSTISESQFNDVAKMIGFNVTGEDGTFGFCRVAIPNIIIQDLWQGNYTVLVDGEQPLTIRNWTHGTYTYIYFTYLHSEHTVTIIPEFPSWLLPSMLLTATLIIVVYKKKHMAGSRGFAPGTNVDINRLFSRKLPFF